MSSCSHSEVYVDVPPQAPPLMAIASWKQTTGMLAGIPSEDVNHPLSTHPGSLFVVYDYNQQGMKAPIALVGISGKLRPNESSAPVTLLCQAPDSTIKNGLSVMPFRDIPASLSPCITKVTAAHEDSLTLNLDEEQGHQGDTYLILLSNTDSNPFTKRHAIPCVISGKDVKTEQMQCKLDTKHIDYEENWGSYIHRVALLIERRNIPQQERTGSDQEKRALRPEMLPLPNNTSPTQSEPQDGPSLESKSIIDRKFLHLAKTTHVSTGASRWLLVGIPPEKRPSWIRKGALIALSSSAPLSTPAKGKTAFPPAGISVILEDPQEGADEVPVSKPCVSQEEPTSWENAVVLPWSLAKPRSLSGPCVASVISSKITKKSAPPKASVILDIGTNPPASVQVGDVYALYPNNNRYPTYVCKITAEGTTKNRARCELTNGVPNHSLRNYHAVVTTDE